MFDEAPLCDLCKKFYACEDIDPEQLPPALRRFWTEDAETDEIICSSCLELLIRYARHIVPGTVQSIREFKIVDCPSCRDHYSKTGMHNYNQFCSHCKGTGKRLAEKSPLERLADAADG